VALISHLTLSITLIIYFGYICNDIPFVSKVGAMNILENNRAMMAIVGQKSCSGVPKFRSSIYNPDPRYDGDRGKPGCGLQSIYIPTGDALKCSTNRMPNMNLYNMPKKGGNNLRIINTSREIKNEVSCSNRRNSSWDNGDFDVGFTYPHRNRATLHNNLKDTSCSCSSPFQQEISLNSYFKCMDCGCKYSQRTMTNSEMNNNAQCNPYQAPKNPVVVQVSCTPESTIPNVINGRTTYLFRFNIQQQGICNVKENVCQKDLSSSVWWTCKSPSCPCNYKNNATNEGFIPNNTSVCTIVGENGQPTQITCHYCFNLNDNGSETDRLFTDKKCNKTRQKSLHGGSCICTLCERLRCETRKRPNYYFQQNKNDLYSADVSCRQTGSNGYSFQYTKACSGNEPTSCRGSDHGPLCGCTDHQKCLNNLSSFNPHYGINCYAKGGDCKGNENLHPVTKNYENHCVCSCHKVAPDNWQLDMEENKQSFDTDDNGKNLCTEEVPPPFLVRNCAS